VVPLAGEREIMTEDWHKAAIAGNTEVMARQLAEGKHVDALDRYGQTALMLAARQGHDAIVALLIDHGAALDVTAKYGLSALMLAVINRHEGIARRLVAAGADLALRGSGAPGFAGKTARALADDSGQVELAAHIAVAGGP
jgi:ankyrin repeat protein